MQAVSVGTGLLTALAGVLTVIRPILKIDLGDESGYRDRATKFATYSLLLGSLAWLLLIVLLVLMHVVTAPEWFVALRAMQTAAGVLAMLGIICCVLNILQPIQYEDEVVRPLLAGAGLAISIGVGVAVVVVGL